MSLQKLLLSSVIALTAVSVSQAAVIFNDTTSFTNWYKSGTTGTLTKGTDLQFAGGGTSISDVIGRSFATTTLAVGDTITASFDLNFTTTPSIFSVGLFNTAGTISADNYAASPYNLGAFTGIYTFARDNNASNSITRDNSGTSNGTSTPLVGGTNGGDLGTGALINYAPATNYTVSFALTLTSASQLDTLFTINDGVNPTYSIVGTDTTSPYSTFNGVFFRNYSSAGDVTFDNITVFDSTSAVPEPSAYALLAGFLGLGFAVTRRRR